MEQKERMTLFLTSLTSLFHFDSFIFSQRKANARPDTLVFSGYADRALMFSLLPVPLVTSRFMI